MPHPDLHEIYAKLYRAYGPQGWWPAESPFEMVIGAILTQNTAWTNVELALAGLRRSAPLSPQGIAGLPLEELALAIRPAGFFRQKAQRLAGIAQLLLAEYDGEVALWLDGPCEEVRHRLLAVPGIGPETADSILLYAGGQATFVVDAYTTRLFRRLGVLQGAERYEEIRRIFLAGLPHEPALFNEYHALIVRHAKELCRKRQPRCAACTLAALCPAAVPTDAAAMPVPRCARSF